MSTPLFILWVLMAPWHLGHHASGPADHQMTNGWWPDWVYDTWGECQRAKDISLARQRYITVALCLPEGVEPFGKKSVLK